MIQAQQALRQALAAALAELAPGVAPTEPDFEAPRQAAHGDLACTAAMQLARNLKRNPREVASQLVEALRRQPAVQAYVESMEIAGPGFINLRLTIAAKQAIVGEVLSAGAQFGRAADSGRQVMVEFVSANPTGPLHVGHGRQAALGDAISHLFEARGDRVTREFYYTDAGVQIATLAASTQARAKGL
jgi:arginyl-tRNA synthetase